MDSGKGEKPKIVVTNKNLLLIKNSFVPLLLAYCKLGRISNSTENNSEFDTEYRIGNSKSKSNLGSKFNFD